MGQSSQEAYRSRGRGNVLFFRASQLTLVTDKKDPLYDPRVELPVHRPTVESMKRHGVIEPIIVTKAGETRAGVPIIKVVDGRQRVKAAEVASAELVAEGMEELLIPAIPRRGDDKQLAGVSMASFIRQEEGPLEQGRRLAAFIGMGHSEAEAGVSSGLSRSAVRLRLALLEAGHDVKVAVAAGRISIDDAAKIAKLPRDEQEAALETVLAEKPGKARKRRARDVAPGSHFRMLGRKRIAAMRDRLAGDHSNPPSAWQALSWVLGELDEMEAWQEAPAS